MTMDTTGFSQIGRYGTLSLVKRATAKSANARGPSPTNSVGANQVITSFGIDNPSLTFGRNLTCDVRLYYPDVEGVHARVMWENEGQKSQPKAALYVLGESGVYVFGPGGAGKGKVEGKWVYPRYPDEDEDGNEQGTEDPGPPQPTIIELPNNAEFEIAHKRFRVTYPPRGSRAKDGFSTIGTPAGAPMLNTPTANKPGEQRRAMRLSMIQSAQVFSPRPSADPRENLRVLQSPLKVPTTPARSIFSGAGVGPGSPSKAPRRSVSPLKFGCTADMDANEDEKEEELEDEPEDQEVILVHTNHPRVVEEDKDLVILEDVPLPLVVGSSSSSYVSPIKGAFSAPAQPQPQLAPPVTPKRKSLGGTALHRAVLIRSAQRAVWKAERERMEEEEEREEELEVLDSVVDENNSDEGDDDDDVEMRSVSDDDSDDSKREEKQEKPLWRKSLEKIIPWRFSSKEVEDEHEDEEKYEKEEECDEEDEKDTLPALQERTPVRRALGSFMTPQHSSSTFEARRNVLGGMGPPQQPPKGRHSLGGGEARRVIVQQPWRVKDLVVPPPSASSSASSTSSTFTQPPNIFPTDPPAEPQLQPRTPLRSVPILSVKSGVIPPLIPPAITPATLPQRIAAGSTPLPAPATARTPAVSAEERRAIQERRRSAVKDAFVLGGGAGSGPSDSVPGMSPFKTSPAKPFNTNRVGAFGSGAAMPRRSLFPSGSTSPTKGRPLGYAIPEKDAEFGFKPVAAEVEEDDEISTNEMLERMRETVESMKRRRSLALGVGSVASTPASAGEVQVPGGPGMGLSPKKLDFTRFGKVFTTPKSETVLEAKTQDPVDLEEEAESAGALSPLPSLLRTPARSSEVPVVQVDVVESVEAEEEEPAPTTTKAKPTLKARLLRGTVPEVLKEDTTNEAEDLIEEMPVPVARSSVQPSSRSRVTVTTNVRSGPKSPLPPAPAPPSRSSPRTPVTLTEETDEATLTVPKTRGARSRSRSKTPQPPSQPKKVEYHPTEAAVDEVEAGEEEAKPVKKTTRTRGGASNKTKPTAVPTPAVAAPSRARSRSHVSAPAPAVDDEPEASLEPEPQVKKSLKPKAARRRANKPTAAPSEDEMDVDDELDSYEVLTPAPSAPANAKTSTSKKTTIVTKAATKTPAAAAKPPSKVASGSRSTGAKRTRTTVQVKQEEEEAEPEPAPVAKRPSSKATKTRTPTSTPTDEPQSKPAPAKRGRPRKNNTAATPTAPVPVNEEEEKENTPGPSASDEAEEQQQVVKVRVSRRAGAGGATTNATVAKTKAAVKASSSATKTKTDSKLKVTKEDEQEEEREEVEERKARTGTRTTRVMRLRTKTG